MTLNEVFVWAAIGGLLAQGASLFNHATKRPWRNLPWYYRTKFYWVGALFFVLAGGALALAHAMSDDVALSALLALNIGATAPLLLEQIMRAAPELNPGTAG